MPRGIPKCFFCARGNSHAHAHAYSHGHAHDYVHGHVYYWQTCVLVLPSFLVQIPACLSQETIQCNQFKSTTETSTLTPAGMTNVWRPKRASADGQNVWRRWWLTLAGAGEGRRLTGSAGASLLLPAQPTPSLRSLPPVFFWRTQARSSFGCWCSSTLFGVNGL